MPIRNDTLFKRYEIFVAAAAIAAHANAPTVGFRQRDTRFLIELFTNWVEGTLHDSFTLNNTQVQRYLAELVMEGYARKLTRGKQPRYRLTRIGLMELLSRLGSRAKRSEKEHFYFLFYFLSNYGPRIADLIQNEGKQFPLALRLEIETQLDVKRLVEEEIRFIETELQKLDERINDAIKTGRLTKKLLEEGKDFPEVVKEVERCYPYELNSRKPLSELISEIPEDLARWELEIGSFQRADQIWQLVKKGLQGYLENVKSLRLAS